MGLIRAWHRTPLWLRLISAMLALVALGLTLTGLFGVRLLRGYLVEQVDGQLEEASQSLQRGGMTGLQLEQVIPSQFHLAKLDREGATLATARSALAPSQPELPDITYSEAVERAGEPFTVDAAAGGGSWRAAALPYADGSATLVLATSLDEVDATVDRLRHIDLLVGLTVLAGLGLVGVSMVRTTLWPLAEIEVTAAAIGRGDLGRRVPDHHPGTEMGRLSRALNAMLEQIERAFGARAASEMRARQSEQRMRQFVADASHELRTPLTSIRGFAELHRQGAVTDPDEVSRLLARIEGEAKRMGLLVDDLLLLARLDQQRPLERAPVALDHIAAAAVEAARAAAPERPIELEVAGDGDRLVVDGDEPRLHQVVGNLLDNALAYSPAGTPVTVRVGRTRRGDADLATAEVIDHGPGLTPEQAERVFERFYRVDAARSRALGGTGLGLSIVAAIVAAHGGTVEVASAPSAGATFRVLLPAAGDGGPDDDGDPAGPAGPGGEAAPDDDGLPAGQRPPAGAPAEGGGDARWGEDADDARPAEDAQAGASGHAGDTGRPGEPAAD
ncbi:MAG TPA: ATP-binding protein [Acidimicrobiales bacterium]|nr:ATP-binding protein [Acidimicrobiales bacterium]